ncbi:hypothetical protein [Streptomyces canus]|uniref:hypothetical protein n=1 Tax=Streptomyces canus TaxID=58343 RepID=UPI00278A8C8D|nr:hypothetical protein [Streptomyces canus]MDQ0758707.1 hypothetical protein [Streptomyces canus]
MATSAPEPADPEDAILDATPDDPNASRRREHGRNGRFTRTLARVRRDAQAAELRAEGHTYKQIADELGYYDKKEAWTAVRRAIADVARPAVTKLISTESAELDTLYAEALAVLQRDHVTVSHGKVIMWLNPETQEEEPLLDDGPKMQAIQLALRVRESYRKLHGLDQPAKIDATVHEVTQQDLELQEMLREAKAKTAAEEQEIRAGREA